MPETTTAKAKAKHAAANVNFDSPEFPSSRSPSSTCPKMEVPAAFREFAEKGVSQAKDNWEKMKAATEEATDLLEDSYATAAKGASDYGLKLIEVARANTNAAFDFASEFMAVKSFSEVVELSTAHARKQFDALSRADQGAHRARPEGRDREQRAAQGRRHQRLQEGGLTWPTAPLQRGDRYGSPDAAVLGFRVASGAPAFVWRATPTGPRLPKTDLCPYGPASPITCSCSSVG